MSSMVIWKDEATGVTAYWNSGEAPTVFVPSHTVEGVVYGHTTHHASKEAAIKAAKRKAKQLTKEKA